MGGRGSSSGGNAAPAPQSAQSAGRDSRGRRFAGFVDEIRPATVRDIALRSGYVRVEWDYGTMNYDSNGDGTFLLEETTTVPEGTRYRVERDREDRVSVNRVMRQIRGDGVRTVTLRAGSSGFGERYRGRK